MAKKKSNGEESFSAFDSVSEEEPVAIANETVSEEEPVAEVKEPVFEEEAVVKEEPAPVPEPVKVVEKPKPAITVDVEAELKYAQEQIEHCLDYVEVQGADYKGQFRPLLKEWRLYKYKLRQHALGNCPAPARPNDPKDY